MTSTTAGIIVVILLFLHAAIERWRLRRCIKRLEHCVFSVGHVNGKDHLVCRCTNKIYSP